MTNRPKKEREQTTKSTIAKLLEMPESSLVGGVHIELNGSSEAVIEGCGSILEYSEEVIRLSGGGMVIRFRGRGLSIGGMNRGGMMVTGHISAVEMIR